MENITQQDWQPVLVAFTNNDFQQVLMLAEKLIRKFPTFAFAYKAKGVALYKLNQQENSIIYLKKAFELDNNDLETINNLTTALSRTEEKHDWELSKKILLNTIYNKKIFDIKTFFNLLITISRFGNWNSVIQLATTILNTIQTDNNNNSNLLNNDEIYEIYSLLAQAKIYQEKYDEVLYFANLMKQHNYTAEVDYYLALCIISEKKLMKAVDFLQQANIRHQHDFKLMIILARTLKNIGEADKSITIFNDIETTFFTDKKASINDKILFYSELLVCSYYLPTTNINIIKNCIDNLTSLLTLKYQKNSSTTQHKFDFNKFKKLPTNELNIGLVSGDFNSHAVSLFLVNLLPHLQKSNINIYIYMNRDFEDHISQKLKKYCKKWTRIFDLNDDEVADKIYDDNIHILFDLSGLTEKHRLFMFALKPAPIQISWIGWLGTSGIPTMDYFLADEFCVPFGEEYEQQFCEKVLRMPHIWEVLTPPNSENLPLPEKNNFNFTFASFNNPTKVNAKTLDLWSEVLKKSPQNTKFCWYRGDFVDKDLQTKFLNEFAKRGVDKNQISLEKYENYQKYLQKITSVDLILDSAQFSGMTTTAEALSLGTPTITLLGDLMPSRLSGSCINAIGDANLNKNFIFDNQNDFVNQAVFFANNKEKLNELKNGLAEKVRKSPLCDAQLFAENFKIKMQQIWNDFLQN